MISIGVDKARKEGDFSIAVVSQREKGGAITIIHVLKEKDERIFQVKVLQLGRSLAFLALCGAN